MAVFMNAQGTQSAVFKFGKRGQSPWSTVTSTAPEVTTGDPWFDIQITKLNSIPRVAILLLGIKLLLKTLVT